MSTRSFIGILGEDNTIQAVYCHSDGYTTYNGVILRDHYKCASKIAALIKLGDLSSLGNEIGERHPFQPDRNESYDAYEVKYGKMCRAYGRDRGDTDVDAKTYPTLEAFLEGAHDYGTEYAYLFQSGGWVVWDLHNNKQWESFIGVDAAIRIEESITAKA